LAITDLDRLNAMLRDTAAHSNGILAQLRARVDDARDDLHATQRTWSKVDTLLDAVSQAIEDKLKRERVDAQQALPTNRSRSYTTVSSDSQVTAVCSDDDEVGSSPSKPKIADAHSQVFKRLPALPPIPSLLDLTDPVNGDLHNVLVAPWPVWMDSFEAKRVVSPHRDDFATDALQPRFQGHSRLKSCKSTGDLRRASGASPVKSPFVGRQGGGRPRADTTVGVVPSVSRAPGPPNATQTSTKETDLSNTARLKAWFKRKIIPERLAKAGTGTNSARSSVEPRSSLTTLCDPDAPGQHGYGDGAGIGMPYRALAAAGKDLARIDERMCNVSHLPTCTHNSDKLMAPLPPPPGREGHRDRIPLRVASRAHHAQGHKGKPASFCAVRCSGC